MLDCRGSKSYPLCVITERAVDKALTVDPVKHGYWIKKRRQVGDIHEETGYVDFDGGVGIGEPITIKVDGRTEYIEWYCSQCGHTVGKMFKSKYCPECGSKMDGEEIKHNNYTCV